MADVERLELRVKELEDWRLVLQNEGKLPSASQAKQGPGEQLGQRVKEEEAQRKDEEERKRKEEEQKKRAEEDKRKAEEDRQKANQAQVKK